MGEIQEFEDSEITFGRHPSCHVQYPKDLTIISRQHAKIIREGNRYKVLDTSTNGTFVNGKRVADAYLKDGDVLIFSEGGPKVSFLTKIDEGRSLSAAPAAASPAVRPQPAAAPHAVPPESAYQPVPAAPPAQMAPAATPAPLSDVPVQRVQMPLVIQYGPTLRSFNELPVTIGRGAGCDFILAHPALLDQQAQIFFSQDQYWIKDLTGRNQVTVNGMPVPGQSPLLPESQLALSPQGPKFRFLGGGRLAEVEEPIPEPPAAMDQTPAQTAPREPGKKPSRSLFKKILGR